MQGDVALLRVRHELLLRPLHLLLRRLAAAPGTAAGSTASSGLGLVAALLSVPVVSSIEVRSAGGRIVSWREDVSVYTLLLNVLWAAKLYNFLPLLEAAAGRALVAADVVAGRVAEAATPLLAPHLGSAAHQADRTLKAWTGWDPKLAEASKHLWT